MTLSLRARLAGGFALFIALTLATFSVAVLWLHARWATAYIDTEIGSVSAAVAQMLEEELSEYHDLTRAVNETGEAMDVPGHAIGLFDTRGGLLIDHANGFRFAQLAVGAADEGIATVVQAGASWRVRWQAVVSPWGGARVVVAVPLEAQRREATLLARIVWLATPIVTLLAAATSWWVASAGLRPLARMAAEADTVTDHTTGQRLSVASGIEVATLARAFNRVLDRLTVALQRQREFMADASHELRSPVSVIQTAAEVTLSRNDRTAAEYREALAIVGDQTARLTRLVDDMFLLARGDDTDGGVMRAAADLDDLLGECVRAMTVVGAARGIRIDLHTANGVTARVDSHLITRLFTNLLENAIRYSPDHDVVTVTLTADERFATITVADRGPGIPLADRERIFERFVRLDPSRAPGAGAGLGLPIARWIAEQHRGTLIATPREGGGTIMRLHLPLSPDERPVNHNPAT